MDIIKIVKKILSMSKNYKINNINDIYIVDERIRILTKEYINKNRWKF